MPRALLATAVLVLAGCAPLWPVTPPAPRAEPALPANWHGAADAGLGSPNAAAPVDLAHWWRQLGDPQLDSLIERALAGSGDLRLAAARLRQARAAREQAVAAAYPTLTASGSANRSRSATTLTGIGTTRTLYDLGFDAQWEIDLFSGLAAGVAAADADLAASGANVANARVSLVAEVAQNYVDLRNAQRRLAIARDNLATQSDTLQIADWRNQAGLATGSDVEQARANREQTRATIPDFAVSLAAAENRLALLTGLTPGALHAELAQLRPLPAIPASVATGIPADVLRQRPDLVAAERSLAAETARVGAQMAKRYPSLNLNASFGWQAFSLGALGPAGSIARNLAGTLAGTLFDGGRLQSAVEVRSAVQEQALISYRNAVLGALEDVENALTAHAWARERLDARRAAATAARNAAQLARQMYDTGLTDFQRVLDTERTRLAAEDAQAQAESTQVASLIKLYKALGGGWQPAAATTATTATTAKEIR